MVWPINSQFPPVTPASSVEWGGGAQRVTGNNNFFVTGASPEAGLVDRLDAMDNKLEGGYGGAQYANNSNGVPIGSRFNVRW